MHCLSLLIALLLPLMAHAGEIGGKVVSVADADTITVLDASTDQRLAELERRARAARVGLWADSSHPVAQWDHRKAKRQSHSPARRIILPLLGRY